MSAIEVLTLVVVVLVLAGWYLSYTAARLHRLQTRVEGALAALDAQLVRRAEAAVELANSGLVDPATSLLIADAAAESLGADDELTQLDWVEGDLAAREALESALTGVLGLALSGARAPAVSPAAEIIERLRDAHERVRLARRFYNNAVTDVVPRRRTWSVQVFRLSGHAILPRTVEFNDDLVEGPFR